MILVNLESLKNLCDDSESDMVVILFVEDKPLTTTKLLQKRKVYILVLSKREYIAKKSAGMLGGGL